MKEHFKMIVAGLLGFPLMLVIYYLYAHVVSFLDPLLTIVLGGGFVLALLVGVGMFFVNMKDFIVSIFKDDKTKDRKGFKKHF